MVCTDGRFSGVVDFLLFFICCQRVKRRQEYKDNLHSMPERQEDEEDNKKTKDKQQT
jgi:hypothetical protein